MPRATIDVMYTCHECNTTEQPVKVRVRFKGEVVTSWVDWVAQQCGFDHQIRRPQCRCRKVDLKIPVSPDGTKMIGEV